MAGRDERLTDAWAALKGATAAVLNRITDSVPASGVSPGHMGYLHMLAEAQGPVAPGSLATALEVTPATVTGALNALEAAGLVQRKRDPDDRRGVLVAITPAGRTVLRRWVETIRSHVRDALSPLSDKDLDALTRLLTRIAPPIHGPPRGLLQALRHDASAAQPGPKAP